MAPSKTSRKLLMGCSFTAFFVVSFVLFAYWSFPYDRVRDYIVQEVERPQGADGKRAPSGFELEIIDLSPSWGTGVELTGVRLVKLAESEEEQPVDVTFESVDASLSLLSLLGGETAVDFDAVVAGGTLEGRFAESETMTSIDAAIADVNLRQIGILRAYAMLPVGGVMNGTVDLDVSDDQAQTAGSVQLDISGLSIGGGKIRIPDVAMLREGLTVERVVAGDLALQMEVDNGSAQIRRLQASGADAALSGSGSIRLIRPFGRSRADVLLRLAFTDAYKNKNNVTQRLFTLVDTLPQVRPYRTDDGALQFRVTGNFGGSMGVKAAGRAPAP